MRKSVPFLALALFLLTPALAKADPLVLINFDSPLPPSAFYQSEGVVFHTVFANPAGDLVGGINNLIVLQASPAAVSPPNAAFAAPINPLFNGVNGISASFVFTNPEGFVLPATTHSVSFNVVGSQGTWTVLFFDDTSQNIFDAHTGLLTTITGSTDQVVVFSSDVGIGRFVFIPSVINGPTGIDNLQFEATAVPEPASLILLGIGFGSALAHKKRRAIASLFWHRNGR